MPPQMLAEMNALLEALQFLLRIITAGAFGTLLLYLGGAIWLCLEERRAA